MPHAGHDDEPGDVVEVEHTRYSPESVRWRSVPITFFISCWQRPALTFRRGARGGHYRPLHLRTQSQDFPLDARTDSDNVPLPTIVLSHPEGRAGPSTHPVLSRELEADGTKSGHRWRPRTHRATRGAPSPDVPHRAVEVGRGHPECAGEGIIARIVSELRSGAYHTCPPRRQCGDVS